MEDSEKDGIPGTLALNLMISYRDIYQNFMVHFEDFANKGLGREGVLHQGHPTPPHGLGGTVMGCCMSPFGSLGLDVIKFWTSFHRTSKYMYVLCTCRVEPPFSYIASFRDIYQYFAIGTPNFCHKLVSSIPSEVKCYSIRDSM
jgi:hypothetical protein